MFTTNDLCKYVTIATFYVIFWFMLYYKNTNFQKWLLSRVSSITVRGAATKVRLQKKDSHMNDFEGHGFDDGHGNHFFISTKVSKNSEHYNQIAFHICFWMFFVHKVLILRSVILCTMMLILRVTKLTTSINIINIASSVITAHAIVSTTARYILLKT